MALQSDTLHQFCTVGEMSQPDALGGSSLGGGFFLSPPGCKKSVLGSRSAEHSLFSVPQPLSTLQGGGFSFSFSSSLSLRLTGRRGTVRRRAIICSFSHTSDRSHFLQSALSLRYSSTIFDQKWFKDQDWHSLFDMKREDLQDATIRCLLLTSVSTCFGHHYAHLQENKGPITAFGVLFWFCWMWLVSGCGALSCRAWAHVSGIIMPIFRRTKALLLHLVCCSGFAGCGW